MDSTLDQPPAKTTTTKRRRRRTRGRKPQGGRLFTTSSQHQHHDDDEDATTVASSGSEHSDSCSSNNPAGVSTSPTSGTSKRGKQQPSPRKMQPQHHHHPVAPPPLTKAQQDRYLAMDCEMVGVGPGGHRSALARVTLVNWDHEVVYDAYVTPMEDVTDYRSYVSGITEHDLLHKGIAWSICRQQVADRLVGKILVGHALKNDLAVLQLSHPWHLIRDTAKYEPFMKKLDDDDNILWPRKLKELAQEKLKREIQRYGTAHCPIEDAVAALQLYKIVRVKWENIMDYKVQKTAEIMQQQQQATQVVVPQ